MSKPDKDLFEPNHILFKLHSHPIDPVLGFEHGLRSEFVFILKLGINPAMQIINEHVIRQIEEQKDRQGRGTNVQGTMTDWYMGHRPGFKELKDIATKYALSCYSDLNHAQGWDIWGNKYSSNEGADVHWHIPAFCSFTYYPYVDDDHPGLWFPDLETGDKTESGTGVELKPESGDLVMWQSRIRHGIKEKEFVRPRYVVAGNIYYQYARVTDDHLIKHHNNSNAINWEKLQNDEHHSMLAGPLPLEDESNES